MAHELPCAASGCACSGGWPPAVPGHLLLFGSVPVTVTPSQREAAPGQAHRLPVMQVANTKRETVFKWLKDDVLYDAGAQPDLEKSLCELLIPKVWTGAPVPVGPAHRAPVGCRNVGLRVLPIRRGTCFSVAVQEGPRGVQSDFER